MVLALRVGPVGGTPSNILQKRLSLRHGRPTRRQQRILRSTTTVLISYDNRAVSRVKHANWPHLTYAKPCGFRRWRVYTPITVNNRTVYRRRYDLVFYSNPLSPPHPRSCSIFYAQNRVYLASSATVTTVTTVCLGHGRAPGAYIIYSIR